MVFDHSPLYSKFASSIMHKTCFSQTSKFIGSEGYVIYALFIFFISEVAF
jgi:hypothetical protein